MWYENLGGASWARLWTGYIRCGSCAGIRTLDEPCPVCGSPPYELAATKIRVDDREIEAVAGDAGAEGRYEDWVYLQLIEREWKRPLSGTDQLANIAESARPSARAAIATIFWTYFETRIERLLRHGMQHLPGAITEDLLGRYSSISARLGRLYRLLFQTTYWHDLEETGFAAVSTLLNDVQARRNQFTHGSPAAIDDDLIFRIVSSLQEEHKSWIALFNRCVSRSRP